MSLLHPKIAELYKIKEHTNPHDLSFIQPNGTYNWENISELLFGDGNISKHDPVYPKSYSEYLPYVQRFHVVLKQSESFLPEVIDNADWLRRLHWMEQHSQMPFIVNEHQNPTSPASRIENLLFLTSALEYSLGNVYQTLANKSPPHLLKDLLDTRELREFLGTCPIFLLKILMGSPESINLRNIVWHGFPLPDEIPHCFVATLLIASASLCDLVHQIAITPRSQVKSFSRFLPKLHINLALVEKNPYQVKATIDASEWVGQWKIYWEQIYEHYQLQNYWRCAILILPQIELVLRKMYGKANNFDITAKLNEYYITMNSIFETSSGENQLFDSFLSKETLHFLYDIFISPFGMRIRDKMSHGEVELDCVNKELCSVLLYAGLNLLDRHKFSLEGYQSRFHLNCLTFEAITASKRSVLELMTMKAPQNLGVEFKWNSEVMSCLKSLAFAEPTDIFRRPRKEPEIMAILMKIAQLTVRVCENYQDSFRERFRMFLSHELRSRARKTLEKMVESQGLIGTILANIVELLVRIGKQKCFENTFDDCQRFCKQTLTVVENLVRYSDRDSNEWLNAADCCNKFQKISLDFISKLS